VTEKKKRVAQLLRGGRLEEAAALLVELCATCPADPQVWMVRSTVHGMRGEYQGVLECADRLLELDGNSPVAYSHRGSALAALGRRDEAIEALQRARKLAPDDPAVLSNLANALYLAERVEEAEPLFRRALEIRPGHLESHYGLGHVLAAMGLHEEAIVCYKRAAQIDPNNYNVWYGFGKACQNTGRLEQAEACFQRALQLTEEPLEGLCALARVARAQGRHDEALAHLDAALEHEPDSIVVLVEQADLYQRMGDRQRAYDRIRQILDAEIVTALIVTIYAFICRHFNECDEVVRLGELLLAQEGLGRSDQIALHFAVGAALNDLEEYDAAFDHYRQGNDLTPHRFDREAHRAELDGLVAGYSDEAVPRMARASNRAEQPVFIVGMPRSGTSLVEQILASHPRVFGAGERADINVISGQLTRRLGRQYHEAVTSVETALLDELAEAHLHHLAELSGAADRVTDKMPQNFEKLGLIAQLFPAARVIHCTRDPRDTCLSIYFQRFNGTHTYAWELEDLAYYYKEYERLMAHWREVLPIEMIEVSYEAVVADLEGEAWRMVEFLGLEWDERCLRFHETERPVATASFDQVRRPIYKGSVGRWRHYERHLGLLLEGLGDGR